MESKTCDIHLDREKLSAKNLLSDSLEKVVVEDACIRLPGESDSAFEIRSLEEMVNKLSIRNHELESQLDEHKSQLSTERALTHDKHSEFLTRTSAAGMEVRDLESKVCKYKRRIHKYKVKTAYATVSQGKAKRKVKELQWQLDLWQE